MDLLAGIEWVDARIDAAPSLLQPDLMTTRAPSSPRSKRIGRRYKYYVTELGRRAITIGLKLHVFFVLPQLGSAARPTALSR